MRSSAFDAKNDFEIRAFLKDRRYIVLRSGQILSKARPGKIIPIGSINDDGYVFIKYMKKKILVHRIVFMRFKRRLAKNKIINHKDGKRTNNSLSNLELISHAKNNQHRFRVLKRPAIAGNAKIDMKIAEYIRSRFQRGESRVSLAKRYRISTKTVSSILSYKTWAPGKTIHVAAA